MLGHHNAGRQTHSLQNIYMPIVLSQVTQYSHEYLEFEEVDSFDIITVVYIIPVLAAAVGSRLYLVLPAHHRATHLHTVTLHAYCVLYTPNTANDDADTKRFLL